MILYLDTSSLLKPYLREPGTEQVKELVAAAASVHTSIVSYAEVRAGLARGRRARRLTGVHYQRVLDAFEADWPQYGAVEVTSGLVRRAGELAAEYYLRGLDALHLASALALQDQLGEPVTFSASDQRLLEAARTEGLLAAL